MDYETIVSRVSDRSGLVPDRAGAGVRAVLTTLAERVTPGQAEDLERELPPELRGALITPSNDAEAFDVDEFCRRVADRAGFTPDESHDVARSVFATLREAVSAKEIGDTIAQLSDSYRAMVGRPD